MIENFEDDKKYKIKEYALIKLGERDLLKLYNSFNESEKEFRAYLSKNEKQFKKDELHYYAIREDGSYIAQLTLKFVNSTIEGSTIKNKRVYFNHLSTVRNRKNIGFEKLLIELIISKLQEKRKNKISIFEYTISVGYKEKNMKKILESLKFQEYKEYINPETLRKEILYIRKDKEIWRFKIKRINIR